MTAQERRARSVAADERCVSAFAAASLPDTGAALVAVGGYGRAELAPYSDLDVVLVSDHGVDLGDGAEQVWYPLWDSGTKLDHSVRTADGMLEAAAEDLRVALGLLDLRHLAGDPNLTLRLRTRVLAQWRRTARDRLPELRRLVDSRHELMGELAHLSVPDLKEAEGGLRDATVLKALVATWLVDVPHVDLERSRLALLDARDVLHDVAGRATDRVAPDAWGELAAGLRLADARRGPAAPPRARPADRPPLPADLAAGRRGAGPTSLGDGGPAPAAGDPRARRRAGGGGGRARPRTPTPPRTRCCCSGPRPLAAERAAELSPTSAARLVREARRPARPWPDEARQLFVRLLASGPGLRAVWETLEETGALDRLLPEWERIRLLPHASVIHRFTVDRHLVETCIEASGADPPRPAARRADGGGPAARHRQGRADRAQRRRGADRPGRREPDGLRRQVRRAGRHPGPLAPAARRDRERARPRRPGDGASG